MSRIKVKIKPFIYWLNPKILLIGVLLEFFQIFFYIFLINLTFIWDTVALYFLFFWLFWLLCAKKSYFLIFLFKKNRTYRFFQN